MIQAIFFDLDGTLADTAPDLGGALNRLLKEESRPPLPMEQLRPHVSGGARALLKVGFGILPEDGAYSDLQRRFLDLYQAHICEETQLFDGMDRVLHSLEGSGIKWGIVTNKAERFTREIVNRLGLEKRAVSVVSGDSTPHPKPAPDPLLLACQQAGVDASACLYVGDDLRDVQAGNAAGMTTVVAAWGYLGDNPAPEGWGANRLIATPLELLGLLSSH